MSRDLLLVLVLASLAGVVLHAGWQSLLEAVALPAGEKLEVSQASSLYVTSGEALLTLVLRNGGEKQVRIERIEVGRGSCEGNLSLAKGESAFVSCEVKERLEAGQVYEVKVWTSPSRYVRAFLKAEELR